MSLTLLINPVFENQSLMSIESHVSSAPNADQGYIEGMLSLGLKKDDNQCQEQ